MTKYGAQNMQISFEYFGAWNRATRFNPLISFCVYSVRGNEMANQGNYTAAIELFSEAIKMDARDFR